MVQTEFEQLIKEITEQSNLHNPKGDITVLMDKQVYQFCYESNMVILSRMDSGKILFESQHGNRRLKRVYEWNRDHFNDVTEYATADIENMALDAIFQHAD